MEHERMRFRTLNLKQLFVRLNKITKQDKLERFIRVAGEFGYVTLMTAGLTRYEELFKKQFSQNNTGYVALRPPVSYNSTASVTIQSQVIDIPAQKIIKIKEDVQKIVEQKIKETKPKRHLDF